MHGSVNVNADGTIDYLPDLTFTTTDSFTYTITDGMNGTDHATVTVNAPANLLTAGAGAYVGTLNDSGALAGYWAVKVSATGVFTGAVQLPGAKVVLKGQFTAAGVFAQDVTVNGVAYHLSLTLDPGRNKLAGSVMVGGKTYDLDLFRTFPAFSAARPTAFAGKYTLLIPPSAAQLADPNSPHGTGYATVTISATGSVTVAGKLGDGQPFSAGSLVTRGNAFPLLADLKYAQHGYLLGLATFADLAGSDFTGPIVWHKPMQTAPGLYQQGFDVQTTMAGAAYIAPAPNNVVKPFAAAAGNASINFHNTSVTKTLTISTANKVSVVMGGAENIVIKITAGSGLFSGTFTPDSASPNRPFGGVIFQKGASPHGEGTYVGTAAADQVLLTPVP
jgi:hypothetical protein